METDGRYMMRNNYRYSVTLLEHCQDNDIPFLYASSASVYGAGTVFREERAHEAPLNVYGYSKFLFDQYVRRMLPERTAQIAGFRYFNVYGPREQHKGRMASVALHFYEQYRREGRVRLFEGSGGYRRRRAAARFRVRRRRRRGQSRLPGRIPGARASSTSGTGNAAPFNDVAVATINAVPHARPASRRARSPSSQREGAIEYVPMPDALVGKYQSFTQADVTRLARGRLRGADADGRQGRRALRRKSDVGVGIRFVSWRCVRANRAGPRASGARRHSSTVEGVPP